jgi:hypothetical protein
VLFIIEFIYNDLLLILSVFFLVCSFFCYQRVPLSFPPLLTHAPFLSLSSSLTYTEPFGRSTTSPAPRGPRHSTSTAAAAAAALGPSPGAAAYLPLSDRPGDALMWGGRVPGSQFGGLAAKAFGGSSSSSPLCPPGASKPEMVPQTARLDVAKVFVGTAHAALVTSRGQLYTWGAGRAGQLGQGAPLDMDRPTRVQWLQGRSVSHVALGLTHTAVLTLDGELYTCGSNVSGELGGGTEGGRQLLPM